MHPTKTPSRRRITLARLPLSFAHKLQSTQMFAYNKMLIYVLRGARGAAGRHVSGRHRAKAKATATSHMHIATPHFACTHLAESDIKQKGGRAAH